MSRLLRFFCSAVGKKFLVGISGLALSGFCLTHMAGNLLLLVGPEAYNKYSHALVTNPLLPAAEIGLLAFFFLHIGLVVNLTMQNRAARGPVSYKASAKGEKKTSFVAKTLILSGLLILTFVVLHLLTFKWGTMYTANYNGVEMRDLYKLVEEKFHEPLYVGWYVFSLVVLCAHLSHGVSASLQSLGIMAANNCGLKMVGRAFAAIILIGFAVQPLYFFFGGTAS